MTNLDAAIIKDFPQGGLPLRKMISDRDDLDLPLSSVADDVDIIGPVAGSDMPAALRQCLENFRMENADQPYLNSSFHAELAASLRLDERSYHFIAHRNGIVLGTVRATPAPFELSYMSPELAAAAAPFDAYYEVSRMMLTPAGRESWVGVMLCFALVEWGLTTSRRGLIAICKRANARRFGFFGFKSLGDKVFHIPHRDNGEYWLMASPWQDFLDRAAQIFGSKITAALVH